MNVRIIYILILYRLMGQPHFFKSKRRIVWWVYANTVLHSKILKNRRDNEYDTPMILKIMQGKIIIFERYLV